MTFVGIAALLAATLVAQDPKTEAPKLQRDAAAVAMVEKYDGLMYNVVDAGLKDLTFSMRMAGLNGIVMTARWKGPDKFLITAAVADDAPEARKAALKALADDINGGVSVAAQGIQANGRALMGNIIEEKLAAKHLTDDVIAAGATAVKIVARGAQSTASFKEQTLTFDDKGLVKSVAITAPTGVVTTVDLGYADKGGKFVRSDAKYTMAMPAGDKVMTQVTTFKWDYIAAGTFTIFNKLTITKAEGGSDTLEFTDIKPNTGIDDSAFPAPAKKDG